MSNQPHSDRSFARLTILVTLLFASASLVVAQTNTVEQPSLEKLSLLKRAVVIITTFDQRGEPLLQGSGFFIKTDCVVTNVHVIKDAVQIRITTIGGKTSTVQNVIATNEQADLALLQVENSLTETILQLEDAAPVEGEAIAVVSNPKGASWKITRGLVGPIWKFAGTSSRIQVTALIAPGSSGGPVVNEHGRVIGIAVMHFDSDEDLNFAVPVEDLKALRASTKLVTESITQDRINMISKINNIN